VPGIAGARIAFAGTPDFAVPSLAMLLERGADVPLVLTQPDRPAGRGRRLVPAPVKALALEHDLTIDQPARLDDPARAADWCAPPDLLVVVAYGLLLPRWVLAWPRQGCINVHASLLPRWRGAAPIQHAILAGDPETGVSIMQMEPGLDTGPVFGQRATPIGERETSAELHDRLSVLGASLAAELLPAILAGTLPSTPQHDPDACYAGKLSKSDALLDWRRAAIELDRQVRAFNPWPVAESRLTDGRRLRIWQALPLPDSGGAKPGTILAAGRDGIDVAAGQGALRIERLQPPGAQAMAASAYLAAHRIDGQAFV
jgi:methionyl-tRNA formyltransferase